MIDAGITHTLVVAETNKLGYLLAADGADADAGRAQLPFRAAPATLAVGDTIEVFVYIDSDAKRVATTASPHAKVGEFAAMRVVDTNAHGAFLDWGLEKDLFVPNRLQQVPMIVGRRYVVHVFRDDRTGRSTGASALREYLDYDVSGVRVGSEVEALVYGRNDIGWLAVVDGRHAGIIYKNEVFHPIALAEPHLAWVKRVRENNKIDLSLQRIGAKAIGDAVDQLRQALIEAGGSLPLHDKSSPDAISRGLGMSKKAFKRALGGLYKAGEVELLPDGTRLK